MSKIVLIGAGSAVFTRGLVADLILLEELGPWELALVDIDPTALETAEGLSRKMVESRDAKVTITASTDRRELLPGEVRRQRLGIRLGQEVSHLRHGDGIQTKRARREVRLETR